MPAFVNVSVWESFKRVQLIPETNYGVIYGHNVRGAIEAKLQATNDHTIGALWASLDAVTPGSPALDDSADFDWQTEAQPDIDQPGFYAYLQQPIFSRYVRWFFEGTMLEYGAIGEAFIGAAVVLRTAPQAGWKETDSLPQVRQTNDAQMTRVYAIVQSTMRGLELELMPHTPSAKGKKDLEQLRQLIWERSKAGAYPVFVSVDTDEGALVFGRLDQQFEATREYRNAQKVTLTITPLPTFVLGL